MVILVILRDNCYTNNLQTSRLSRSSALTYTVHRTCQYSTVQYKNIGQNTTVHSSDVHAVQSSAVEYSSVKSSAVEYSTVEYSTVQESVLGGRLQAAAADRRRQGGEIAARYRM